MQNIGFFEAHSGSHTALNLGNLAGRLLAMKGAAQPPRHWRASVSIPIMAIWLRKQNSFSTISTVSDFHAPLTSALFWEKKRWGIGKAKNMMCIFSYRSREKFCFSPILRNWGEKQNFSAAFPLRVGTADVEKPRYCQKGLLNEQNREEAIRFLGILPQSQRIAGNFGWHVLEICAARNKYPSLDTASSPPLCTRRRLPSSKWRSVALKDEIGSWQAYFIF